MVAKPAAGYIELPIPGDSAHAQFGRSGLSRARIP